MVTEAHVKRFAKLSIIFYMVTGILLWAVLTPSPRVAMGMEAFHTSIGFSISTFLDVDKDRAQSITGLWTSLIVRKWGGTTSTRVCSSLSELEKDIRSKKIDLVVLLSSEYLEIRGKVPLEPLFVSAKEEDIYDRLILVVRRDSAAHSLSDLKGKTLIQQKGLYADGRNLWIDTLLMRKGVKDPESFFSRAREVLKPSTAILPVFFRKEDACVVTLRSLQLMAELNPQLSRELLVLEESPPRPSCVIAIRRGLPVRHREMLQESLGALDRDIQGKQLLTLFRMNRLVPFRPEYLVPMDKLFREHRDLKMRLAKRK